MDVEQLKFPIGKYSRPEDYTPVKKAGWIEDIATLPEKLNDAIKDLSEVQLNTPYRPNGWTVKQLIHHIADSHMNAYMRAKLALTEDIPTIKPYDQDGWANTPDCELDITIPMSIIEMIHLKWVHLYRNISDDQFKRVFFHPEVKKEQSIEYWLSVYAWHGNHHLAHITELVRREEW